MIYGKRLNIFCLLSIQYYANFLYKSCRIARPYSVLHILVSWPVGQSSNISARRSVGFMLSRGSSCMSFSICSKIGQLVSRQKILLEGSISLSGFSSRSRKRWTLALGRAPKRWLSLYHSVVMVLHAKLAFSMEEPGRHGIWQRLRKMQREPYSHA